MANNVPSSDHPTLQEQLPEQEIQPRRLISQDQIMQISQNLKEQILKSIEDMKVVNNEATSESHQAQLVVPLSSMSSEETPKKRGKKRTTKVIGEFSLSFEVPHICIENNLELDNSILSDERASSTNKKSNLFSFTERLQNWTFQQRERINGVCDVYYKHISGSSFRTKKEVLNFLMYEKYPPKPNNNNKKDKKVEVGEASGGDATKNESLGKEKQKCDEEIDQRAIDKERVEKFLAESYDNLMNYDFGDCDDSDHEM